MPDRAQQLAIVQRMVDAGESEQNIATVIQHFKTQAPTAAPKQPSKVESGFATLGDVIIGALKGGGETAINLGAMLHKIPGVSEVVDKLYGDEGSDRWFDAAKQTYTQPTNTAQSIGHGAEQVAELFAGGGVIGATTRAIPRLAGRMVVEGVGGAAMNAAHGQSPTAGGVVGAALPVAGRAIQGARAVLRGAGANPVVREAVDWAASRGVPVDAATATGAPIVRAIQGAADATPIGGLVAARARNQADEALTRVGRSLAGDVATAPATMLSAGEGIQGRLADKVRVASKEADDAYEALRKIEAKSQTMVPVRPVTNVVMEDGTRTTGNILGHVPMAVDLGVVRKQLAPLYQQMLRASELAQPMGAEARALKAIDRLMTAEGQHAPLSVVDDALGDLKSVLRSNPDKLGKGAGALTSVVASLDAQVMAAAKRAGPEAVKALQDGRAATVRKYTAAHLLDQFSGGMHGSDEAVRVSSKLTQRADTSVGLLRDLAKTAPDELPKVGRAVIDDLLELATKEGGFARTAGVYEKWNALGPETKKLLFKPEVRANLDRFFLAAKRMGESPNPSMSGTIGISGGTTGLALMNPATGIPLILGAGALSKLLHSTRGAQMLNQVMSVPKTAPQYPGLLQNLTRVAGLEASQAIGGGR